MHNNELGDVLLQREQNKPSPSGKAGGPSLQPPPAAQQPFQTGMQPPAWAPPATTQGPLQQYQGPELPVPPTSAPQVPPRVQRWKTAQHMIDGYQNNWSPNPMLVRILEGSR